MTSKRIFDLDPATALTGSEIFEAEQDGQLDSVKVTTEQIINAIKLFLSGSGKQFDADLLDGQHSTYYLNASNISTGTLPPARGGTGVSAFSPSSFFYASSANTIGFLTPTQVRTTIQAEPAFAAGTISQYLSGDKTWKTLDKSAVGLSAVDNTSDLNKPISTATQDALNLKANSVHTHTFNDITNLSLFTGFDSRYYTKTEQTTLFAAKVHTHEISEINGLQTQLDLKVNYSLVGSANGIASLGSDGKIPQSQLPAIAITDTYVLTSEAAMLSSSAQVGDIVIRTDVNKTFILAASPATDIANWQELVTPISPVQSVFGRTGIITAQAGDYSFAQIGSKPTTLSGYGITDATPSSHIGSGGAAHATATTTVAGFMSAADKTKLDGIDAGAKASHSTLTNLSADDHPQYYNSVRLAAYTGFDSRYYTKSAADALLAQKENTGVAQSLVTAHELATDPHTQYYNQSRGDARYRKNVDSLDWNDLINVPTEFPPEYHTHVAANITDLDDYVKAAIDTRAFVSTGLISGGHLSINATDPSKFDVEIAKAVFADYTDPENPTSTIITTGPHVGLSVTNILTSLVTYVGIASDGSIVQQSTEWSNEQRRTIVSLGLLVHSDHTNIITTNDISATTISPVNQLHDFMRAIGQLNASGNIYFANGANLSLNKTSGRLFKLGSNFHTNPDDPHFIDIPSQTAITFRYRLQNSTEYSNTTVLDPNHYDLNGFLTPVPYNKFSVQRVVLFQSGLTRIQYGQHVYDTLEAAKAAFANDSYVTEQNMAQNGFLRAYIILKKGATSLQNTSTSQIFTLNKFGAATSAGVSITSQAIIDALGYTPASQMHTHNISDIINLQTTLDAKQPLDSDLTAIAALPNTSGYLKKLSDGSWDLDPSNPTTGAAGLTGQIQYNNSGDFGASSKFTFEDLSSGVQDKVQLNLGVLNVVAENTDTSTVPSDSYGNISVTKNGQTASFTLKVTDSDVVGADNTYFEIDLGGVKLQGNGTSATLPNNLTWNNYKIFHAGNGGPSSGFDSDLLDSQHGSYYLDWNNFTNVPTTFDPAPHTHTTSDITDLASYTGFDVRYYTQAQIDSNFINITEKGAANGVAELDGTGKLYASQLPSIAITDTFVVNSEVAQLALSAQTGDIAIRTDLNKTYILAGSDPSILANWQEIVSPTAAVTSVFGRTGAISAQSGDYSFAQIGSKPTTLSGYGITDATPSSHIGSGDGAHALVTTSVAGFMSAADKLKLDGIASGATSNTGTVTSVGLSTSSTGLTITNSPITSSGNINVELSSNLQAWSGVATSSKANDASVVHLAGTETVTGSKTFTAEQIFSSDTTTPSISLISSNDTSSTSNSLRITRKRTSGAVQAGDSLGSIGYRAYYDATNSRRVASIEAYASETHSSTAGGTLIQVGTVSDGSTGLAARWQWLSSGHYVPVINNSYNIGDSTRRVAVGYFNNLDIGTNGIALNGNSTIVTSVATFASSVQVVAAQFDKTLYQSAKILLQIKDTVTGETQVSEILVAHDGTNAYATEYGAVYTGSSPLATIDVDISGSNVRILSTRTTTNATKYTTKKDLIAV